MKPFGWIQPLPVAPAELRVGVSLWLAAGAALSALSAWLVRDVLALRAFSEPGLLIALIALLWLASAFLADYLYARLTTWWALAAQAALSLLSGLLFAGLLPLEATLMWFGIIGGMYLLNAVFTPLFGSRPSAGGHAFFMALGGILLAIAVNSLSDSSILMWTGSLVAVVVLSAVSARRSKMIHFSARQLYAREFTTVQSCAIRGALAVRLGVIGAIFALLELLSALLTSLQSR